MIAIYGIICLQKKGNHIMNKNQLIDSIVEKTGFSKKDANAAVSAIVETISQALIANEKLQLAGLGTFEVKTRAERKGRNPKTQETITIPASRYPSFSASKTLKDSMNG